MIVRVHTIEDVYAVRAGYEGGLLRPEAPVSTYKGPPQESKAAGEDARPATGAPTLEGLASRLLGGVRALSVVAGTGAGAVKLKGHADARQLLAGLVRGRELLLMPAQRRELDGLVARCKVMHRDLSLARSPTLLQGGLQCWRKPVSSSA